MNLNHIAKKPFFDLFYRSPCMAHILRAALTDSGVLSKDANTHGSKALLRFPSVLKKLDNSGLTYALEQLEDIKTDGNHITTLLSYSDIIQLGGLAAVEYCGGPSMVFRMGREDATETESHSYDANAHDSLLSKMLSLGFSKRDFAALMGSYTLGFSSLEATGAHGRWTQNPHVFDNSYYKEVLLGEKSKFMKTPNEWQLLEDSELKSYCE